MSEDNVKQDGKRDNSNGKQADMAAIREVVTKLSEFAGTDQDTE